MYLDFFDLNIEPFAVTPDPDFLYLTPGYREALASVIYGIEQRKGFIVLIGEVGTGKTTILRASLAAIQEKNTKPFYIFNASISFPELVKTLLRDPDSDDSIDKLIKRLHLKLVKEYQAGNNVAVIIDEAQNMSVETLESLRMLSNLETNKNKLLQIILAGQPELDRKLNLHELRQLKQRIAIRATTSHLNSRQSLEYIEHRLVKAGQSNLAAIFDRGAINQIIKHAKGNPRIINMICDNALIASYGIQKHSVSTDVVKEVIAGYAEKPGASKPLLWKLAPLAAAAFLAGATLATLLSMNGQTFTTTEQNEMATSSTLKSDSKPTSTDTELAIQAAVDGEKTSFSEPNHEHPASEQSRENNVVNKAHPLFKEGDRSQPDDEPATQPSLPAINSPTTENIKLITQERQQQDQPTSTSTSTESDSESLEQELSGSQATATADNNNLNTNIKLVSISPIAALDTLADPMETPISVQIGAAAETAIATETETAIEPFPIIKKVKAGDSLAALCLEVYGFFSPQIIDHVKTHNPHINNVNLIVPGDEIVFPNPEAALQEENLTVDG